MNLATFLTQATAPMFWQQGHSFCFTGPEYPATFFNALFTQLRQQNTLPAPYQKIHILSMEARDIQATLSQSMLGLFSFFWLGNTTEERETKASLGLHKYLSSYQGPNIICFFSKSTDQASTNNHSHIELPQELSFAEFGTLARFFNPSIDAKKVALVQGLFNQGGQPLDICCLLLNYLDLASARNHETFKKYLFDLYGQQASLNELSEAFFSRQSNQFYQLWSQLNTAYPDIFWVIFWSEQLWKAIHVTQYLQEKNFVQAKKMSFRLPYSFINKHWQKTNPYELTQAYEFLYQIDYAIKTGSSFCSLDLFFINYFAGTFAKESVA